LAGDAAALLHGAEGGESFDALGAALLDAFDSSIWWRQAEEPAMTQGGVQGGRASGGGNVGLGLRAGRGSLIMPEAR
jgi:hypothetical protein